MPSLTIYKLHDAIDGAPLRRFDQVVEREGHDVTPLDPMEGLGFDAQLFTTTGAAREPSWATFLRSGVPSLPNIRSRPVGALLVIRLRINRRDEYFAMTFGQLGRFLLRRDAFHRGYGLRAALNILQGQSANDPAKFRALDVKSSEAIPFRTRVQASRVTAFEDFDVNQLRDMVQAATGRPADTTVWGQRITGSDALSVGLQLEFTDVGPLCRRIHEAHGLTVYRAHFNWVDDMQPVTDPQAKQQLEAAVLELLKTETIVNLDLAPPEVINWANADGFRYPFDSGRGQHPASRPDITLKGYLKGVDHKFGLDNLTLDALRHAVVLVDAEGHSLARWSVWQCLVGELTIDSSVYVMSDGDFFHVDRNYLRDLNRFVDAMPQTILVLPEARVGTKEGDYNIQAAESSSDYLLLDRKLVAAAGRTTEVEVCDLLTSGKQLVHVKKLSGSRDLSHLFAQGRISAELLQANPDFQAATAKTVALLDESGQFGFFGGGPIDTKAFEVVYAILSRKTSRKLSAHLPFFSKINLRGTAEELRLRGYRVAMKLVRTVV